METLNQLGTALRILRRRFGLKQLEVIARSGLNKSMLSRAESHGQVTVKTLDKILTGIGADLHDLAYCLDVAEGRRPPPRPISDSESGPLELAVDDLTEALLKFKKATSGAHQARTENKAEQTSDSDETDADQTDSPPPPERKQLDDQAD